MATEPEIWQFTAGTMRNSMTGEYFGEIEITLKRKGEGVVVPTKFRFTRRGELEKSFTVIPDDSHTPAAGLARAVLADPDDVVKWGALLDQLGESFSVFPDVERERERLAEEIRTANDLRVVNGLVEPTEGKLGPLLKKLRDLGYGEAVDEYLRPRVFDDTFTEADGTALVAHTGDAGITWQHSPSR